MPMNTPMPDEEKVRETLREVMDPEVNMNIVDLGLVYGVKITDNKLQVDLTMTTQACPMGEMIIDEARYALKGSADLFPPLGCKLRKYVQGNGRG